jgi:ssDNA-binding Zn-finger/Zn-ribbon topoisomerase 1
MNSEELRVRCPKCGADGKYDIIVTYRVKKWVTVRPHNHTRKGLLLYQDEWFHAEDGPKTYTCEKCNYSSRSERVWIEVK